MKMIGMFIIILFTLSLPFADGWEKTYGIQDWSFECAKAVFELGDSCYIVGGFTEGVGPTSSYFLWLRKNGDTLWTKIDTNTLPCYIIPLADTGYATLGYTVYDDIADSYSVGIMIYDNYGNLMNEKILGGENCFFWFKFSQTSDGGLILPGLCDYRQIDTLGYHFYESKIYIVRINDTGDTLWTQKFDYGGLGYDYGVDALQTSDGGFFIVANVNCGIRELERSDIWLLRLNPFGDTLWTRVYDSGSFDFAHDAVFTQDSGLIIAGSHIMRVDSIGNLLWRRGYDFGVPGGYDSRSAIITTSDGNYLAAGTIDDYSAFLKINGDGDTLWTRTFGGIIHWSCFEDVKQTSDGGYIAVGQFNSPEPDSYDVFVVKTDSLGEVSWISEPNIKPQDINISAYPNPFNSETRISISVPYDDHIVVNIYDISGNIVKNLYDGNIESGIHNFKWNGIDGSGNIVSSGIYFVKINTSTKEFQTKIVLTK